ncbi:hypothetical protein L2E82_30452 [Cichorium intybus]|uniref:Uncharacterized protein n=1 Tax=Cichorium intybus TaxID=13427 RepID=A0ACB9D0L4_CICIN|nr:hypothetical protein L2E82_30452 [Cichorium intybus]
MKQSNTLHPCNTKMTDINKETQIKPSIKNADHMEKGEGEEQAWVVFCKTCGIRVDFCKKWSMEFETYGRIISSHSVRNEESTESEKYGLGKLKTFVMNLLRSLRLGEGEKTITTKTTYIVETYEENGANAEEDDDISYVVDHPKNGDWKTMYRKKPNQNSNNDGLISLFVSNIPNGVSKQELKAIFEKFGRVVDVYQAMKKDRNGSNFAFIRFTGAGDGRALEKSIGRVHIGHYILVVNIAKFQRKPPLAGEKNNQPQPPPPPPFTSSRSLNGVPPPLSSSRSRRGVKSFAQVVAGSDNPPSNSVARCKEIALSPSDEIRVVLNDTVLIGEVTNMMTIRHLPELFEDCGISFEKVHYYGGLQVIISFANTNDAERFLSNKESWSRWFYWIKVGREIMYTPPPPQRIANIRIVGLPLEFRSISNIKEIVDHFGLVLEIEEDIWGRLDLSYCGATILTKSMIKINEEIIISFGPDKFSIGITEDEIRWNPFDVVNDFPNESGSDESGSDDDDDGVSDTWTNNHDHMYEEGEIPPDEDGRDDGAEKSVDAHESPVATPVVERSILNDDEVGGKFQSRLVGVEESGRRIDQNNNNNFVFNVVNDYCGPIPAVNGEARDLHCRFNGLLSNRSFGPFPLSQTNKRFRVESVCPPSHEASINLNRDITLSNNSMGNVATVDCVPDFDQLEVSNVDVANEQQMTAEIGNMLGIDVAADNEVLTDVMGEGANNGLQRISYL